MKKRIYLVICAVMLSMTNLIVSSCGSDNEPDTGKSFSVPYGKWVLSGYVHNGNFVNYEDSETRECFLILNEDGSYQGRFCNSLQGDYSYSRNGEFNILSCTSTMIMSTDSDLMFMEELIVDQKVGDFEIDGNRLNLYYAGNDCLVFTR